MQTFFIHKSIVSSDLRLLKSDWVGCGHQPVQCVWFCIPPYTMSLMCSFAFRYYNFHLNGHFIVTLNWCYLVFCFWLIYWWCPPYWKWYQRAASMTWLQDKCDVQSNCSTLKGLCVNSAQLAYFLQKTSTSMWINAFHRIHVNLSYMKLYVTFSVKNFFGSKKNKNPFLICKTLVWSKPSSVPFFSLCPSSLCFCLYI